MPVCASESSISRSLSIMPWLSTPRIRPTLMVVSMPGIQAPGAATTTLMPARALGAPQTICFSPSAVATRQTRSLSASGCGRASMTSPTVKAASRSAGLVTFSTSSPRSERAKVTSSSVAAVSRCSLSQARVNFMLSDRSHAGCARFRRSRARGEEVGAGAKAAALNRTSAPRGSEQAAGPGAGGADGSGQDRSAAPGGPARVAATSCASPSWRRRAVRRVWPRIRC